MDYPRLDPWEYERELRDAELWGLRGDLSREEHDAPEDPEPRHPVPLGDEFATDPS